MAVMCFTGVFLANLILELGFARLISKPLAPLLRFANLPTILASMITVIDVRGALDIVSSLREENRIDDSTVTAYTLITRPLLTAFYLFRLYLPST